jgi:hypothetical protein
MATPAAIAARFDVAKKAVVMRMTAHPGAIGIGAGAAGIVVGVRADGGCEEYETEK